MEKDKLITYVSYIAFGIFCIGILLDNVNMMLISFGCILIVFAGKLIFKRKLSAAGCTKKGK